MLVCGGSTDHIDSAAVRAVAALQRSGSFRRTIHQCKGGSIQDFNDMTIVILLIMQAGWVVEWGKTADIYRKPQAEYTKKLLLSANIWQK